MKVLYMEEPKKKVKRVRKTSRLAGHGKVPIQESRNYAEALPQEEEENGDAWKFLVTHIVKD